MSVPLGVSGLHIPSTRLLVMPRAFSTLALDKCQDNYLKYVSRNKSKVALFHGLRKTPIPIYIHFTQAF